MFTRKSIFASFRERLCLRVSQLTLASGQCCMLRGKLCLQFALALGHPLLHPPARFLGSCCTRFCFCEFALRMSGLCAHDIGDVSRRTLHSTSALSSPSRLALGLVITFKRVVAGSSLSISRLWCEPYE